MGAAGIRIQDTLNVNGEGKKSGFVRGILFVAPSVVITVVSYLLFAVVRELTAAELRELSVTIMTAVLVSLVGTAPVQLLIYRIVDEGIYAQNAPAAMMRGLRTGIVYSIIFALAAAALLYPVFTFVLGFSSNNYFYFTALVIMYSLVWVVTTNFWASRNYRTPAVVFTFGYAVLFFLTWGFYELDPAATLPAYTTGIGFVLLFAAVAARNYLKQAPVTKPAAAPSSVAALLRHNVAAILFQVLYVAAIFLDKVSVWVAQGIRSGSGLELTGPYTIGAFLGVIPLFAVASTASFAARASVLTQDLYKGSLAEIRARANAYRHFYTKSLITLMATTLVLYALTTAFTWYFVGDADVLAIELTIGAGAFFFLIVILDSSVLPLFGEIRTSTLSVFIICLSEAIAALFVSQDVWYAAAGFAVGSFLGFLVSQLTLLRLFSRFEYYLFRNILKDFVG